MDFILTSMSSFLYQSVIFSAGVVIGYLVGINTPPEGR
tara:strand:+ start:239 stop:352 length:114 start_codon:yes stop_codon:yes gene_type:complete